MIEKERSFWEILKRFLVPLRMKLSSVFTISWFAVVDSLIWVSIIYWIQYIVKAIEIWDSSMFYRRTRILVVVAVLWFLTKIIWKPYMFKFFSDLQSAIDTICLPIMINWNNNKYEKIGTGKLTWIYTKWTHSWMIIAMETCWHIFWALTFFLAFLITVYQKDLFMFLWIIGVLLLIMIRFYYTWSIHYPRRKKAKITSIQVSRLQTRWFMNKFEIMQQWKTNQELSARYKLNDAWYNDTWYEKFYQWISYDWSILFAMLMFIGLVFYTGKSVFTWLFSYSDLVVIVGLWSAFVRDLDGLTRRIRSWVIDKRIDVEKLRDLLDDLDENVKKDSWEEFHYGEWNITLKNICYGYESWNNVIDDFWLEIQWWSKTALVWISWSWKSTLIKLIAWYLQTNSGSIIIDGQNLNDISLKSYYKHIWYLTQDPSVFDWTILDNLTYALDWNVSEEKIREVVSLAKCEFIRDFPNGLQTEIGERGIRLSWWQRQRLAIAKVFLKDPKIILLDEPTSALDSFSEEWITEAMHNLFEWRTVLIIAHRLQTVKRADDIIVLEQWKIMERWTHISLVKSWGVYAKMLELQSWF